MEKFVDDTSFVHLTIIDSNLNFEPLRQQGKRWRDNKRK